MWSEFSSSANQHPKHTIKKKKKPTNLCTTCKFVQKWVGTSCYSIMVYPLDSVSNPNPKTKTNPSIHNVRWGNMKYLLKNVSAVFDNHKILLYWLSDKQTFHMISLLDQLCFLVCSRDHDILCVQRSMVYRKSHDMDTTCTQENNVWPLPQSSK